MTKARAVTGMKPDVGCTYRTRNGVKALVFWEVLIPLKEGAQWFVRDERGYEWEANADGKPYFIRQASRWVKNEGAPHSLDLVERTIGERTIGAKMDLSFEERRHKGYRRYRRPPELA